MDMTVQAIVFIDNKPYYFFYDDDIKTIILNQTKKYLITENKKFNKIDIKLFAPPKKYGEY